MMKKITTAKVKKDFISFFEDCKKMDAKELFAKWKFSITIRKCNRYQVEHSNRIVRAIKYSFLYKQDTFAFVGGNLIEVYFYNNKPVKVDSYVKGLDSKQVIVLINKAKLSPRSNKITFFDLFSGGYNYKYNCSNRYLLAVKLGYIREDEVNKILTAKKVSVNLWREIKFRSYKEWHHYGDDFRKVNFYSKSVLLETIKKLKAKAA